MFEFGDHVSSTFWLLGPSGRGSRGENPWSSTGGAFAEPCRIDLAAAEPIFYYSWYLLIALYRFLQWWESNEIVSSPVKTSGNRVTFSYEGKAAIIISLPKGADYTGNCGCYSEWNSYMKYFVEGSLGGYSWSILNLNQNEAVYVYVGDGSVTEGSFPDGGYHWFEDLLYLLCKR